jgi:hypothetical protein
LASKAKGARIRAGARERFLIMANAARRDLFAGGRGTGRRVASVTLIVGRETSGNCERRGVAPGPAVTRRTAVLRPRGAVHVLRVIKLDVEAFFEPRGKTSEWRVAAVDVAVADDAHRYARSYKLPGVATDASFVSREARRRGIVAARVTRVAGEGSVTLAVVLES